MKTQAQVLIHTRLTTDKIYGIEFTPEQQELLDIAEGFAFDEWSEICSQLGLCAIANEVPINYEKVLRIEGRWRGGVPEEMLKQMATRPIINTA